MRFAPLALLAGFALIGCEASSTPTPVAAVRPDVTDIRPLDVTASSTPAAYSQPIADAAPAPAPFATTETPALQTKFTGSNSGKTHKVARGETLYAIARATYGDGKQWKKIAAANPGVDTAKLRVGQEIVIP